MDKPSITTIIPTFQRPHLLKRAIYSVLQQTHPSFLIYVSDNASEDETGDIVAAFQKKDSRIIYSRHKRKVSLAQNFADSLENIQTPFFSFLSDDDYLLPNFYEMALNGFKTHPEAGFSCCRTITIDQKGKVHPLQFKTPWLQGFFPAPCGALALTKCPITPFWTAILFRREVLNKVGGIQKRAGTAIDFEFILKCSSAFSFVSSGKPAAAVMLWKGGTSSTASIDSFNFDVIYESINRYMKTCPIIKSKLIYQLQERQIIDIRRLWFHLLLSNQLEEARKAKKLFFQLGGSKTVLHRAVSICDQNIFFRKIAWIAWLLRKSFYALLNKFSLFTRPEMRLFSRWAKTMAKWTQT
jgi:glycosyltransferase involved in cell wall biosynthesis